MNEALVRNSSTFNDDRDVMVFVRIPKTGSTSFAQMFQSAVGPDHWANLPDWRLDAWDMGFQRAHDQLRRFGMRVERDVRRLGGRITGQRDRHAGARFLHGHFPLWAPLPTQRHAHYVSLVRDPVDRFLSQYFYIRGKAEARRNGGSGEKRRVLQLGPDDFVDCLLASPARQRLNGQCLYLASSGTLEDACAALDHKVLASATLTDLGEVATVVSQFMRVPAPAVRRANVSGNRPRQNPLGPRTETRLRAALEADVRLFAYVQENRDRLLDTTRLT